MKFLCAQEALAEALATVGHAVPAKSTLPILSNVLLEADATGWLRLTATNLELAIARQLAATVSSAGRVTVPARLLSDYVALLDRGKQVSLSLGPSGGKLHLACDRFEAHIATLPADDFPPLAQATGGTCLEVDGAALKTAINQVVFAAAPDESRPVLAGVLVRLEAGMLTLAAADGYRLAVRSLELPQTTATARWVVPARTLVEVARCLPSAPGLPVTVSSTASDQQLHIGLGATEITTRLVEGQFPDYERIIPGAGATTVIVGTADLLQATRAATVFARDDAHIVRLACTPPPDDGTPALGRLAVTGTSAERGDHAGQLEASVGGAAVQIAFNGRYLRDALEADGTTQVGLQFSGARQPGVLRSVGELETAHLHVIMPMLRR